LDVNMVHAHGMLSNIENALARLQKGDVTKIAAQTETFESPNENSLSEDLDLASDKASTVVETAPTGPIGVEKPLVAKSSNCVMVENVPDTHRYRLTTFMPQNQRKIFSRQFVKKLPYFVKTFLMEYLLKDLKIEWIFFL